jgi:excisionase family DNA binding protein
MTTKSCANGRGCAAVAVLGEPAKLSRYNQEGVCSECLLRARRGGAEEEDMRNALRAARKKKPSAKDKAKGKRGAAKPEPEAQATLPRLVKDLEGIASALRIQQRQFADTARTLAQTGEDLARVAEALEGNQAPKESRRSEATVNHGDTKKPAKDRQWFKVSEVAERLAISTREVYVWISAGELAATRFGPQTIRVRVSELERFEEEGIE